MSFSAASGHVPAGFSPELPEGGRRSHALENLTSYLAARPSMHILDMGGINQANLDFLTGLGHRLYAEDLVRSFDGFFTAAEVAERHYPADRIDAFIRSTLDFPDHSTDGALLWDALQFLPASVSQAFLQHLRRILAPDSIVLAFFHPESGGQAAVPHSCRILDAKHLQMRPRGLARPIQPFNARSIEKFFHGFRAVKFFMTRESLQEVVVRR